MRERSLSGYHVWPPVLPDPNALDTFFGDPDRRASRERSLYSGYHVWPPVLPAVNGTDSLYSGYHVWPPVLPDAERLDTFFGEVIQTGAHRASGRCIREQAADVCAVDCVMLALLGDHLPGEISGTRILTTSPQAPGAAVRDQRRDAN